MSKILEKFEKSNLQLKNHVVMAPMTRSRAIGNIPNELMAEYYAQRSNAGLIITEGTSPAPEGLGYARIPGIFSAEQTEGWKKVTAAVHANDAKIFVQLMHTGRIGHESNLPTGSRLAGVSDVRAAGQIWTDGEGMQPFSQPEPLSKTGVEEVIEGYVKAAQNAIEAGFDGIELHAANGYLLEQFLNPHTNNRTDEYGGSIENRARAVLLVVEKVAAAIGREKVGIRFSPFSTFNDLPAYDAGEVTETYAFLANKLNGLGIAYLHLMVTPDVLPEALYAIRGNFEGAIIQCAGLTPESAQAVLADDFADLVAFGQLFLANPDLVTRIETGGELNEPDYDTFYTPDEKGYTDYPKLSLV
ncbi:alkene reductase [Dyadobacter aurulentus]|uniref:alkene reductase n=1 Tax=Dyadobacter sp. UC 10 TaxID=2605428 RepID=UPI0011F0B0A0|nr:alkene reductase [Dyadobacter sp. UC 10]KAA0992880.1 alkene reductase [Dyadobacter sp. UC 10]